MRARRPRSQGMPDMVFIEIIRYSPRRRASPWIAEGFSPTARGAYRMIAFLAKFEPNWTGLNIPRVAPHAMTEIMVFEEIIRYSPRRRALPCIAEGFSPTASAVERIYSSSHKDWSCWAELHLPSKADAVCALPPRAPRLCVHQTGSHGGAEARRSGAQRSGRLAQRGRPG